MISPEIVLEDNIFKLENCENISWYCETNGNFTLSQYYGNGDVEILVSPLPNIPLIGYVEFVFNGEHCPSKWKFNVQGESVQYYFYVTPSEITLEGNEDSKTIYINTTSEFWNFEVETNTQIKVTKTSDNTVTVTSLTDDEITDIYITFSDNITIKKVKVNQPKIEECILEAVKTPNGESSNYQISVASYQGGIFVPYTVNGSQLNNYRFTDNTYGLINVYVNDINKNASGSVAISNFCGKQISVGDMSYTASVLTEGKFVIVNGDSEYTSITINFGEYDNIEWNGYAVNMPYKDTNSITIESIDMNKKFVNWRPVNFDSDDINIQYSNNKLDLKLINYNELSSPQTIVLQNDEDRQIIISYTVSAGLFIEDTYIFQIGDANGNNKSDNYSTTYNNAPITITLDSFLRTQNGEYFTNWNCISVDPIIGYTVEPSYGSGGTNQLVVITCNSSITDQLESDYVGKIVFQQIGGDYKECTASISHKAVVKDWYEKSRTLVSIEISPSSVELSPCNEKNYSETISCLCKYEVIYELKTSQTSNTVYATKTEYVSDTNYREKINWTKIGSEEIDIETVTNTDSNGTYYTYKCVAPSNLYNVGSYRSTLFQGVVGNITLTLQCNQNTSTLTEDTSQGEATIVGVYIGVEMKDTNYDGKEDNVPRSGDTRDYYGMSAEIMFGVSRVDSCENIIPGFDTAETETITEGLTLETEPEGMFNLNTKDSKLEILENPWIYTFTQLDENSFNIQAFDENTYKKKIHSSRDVESRTGSIWVDYNGMDSDKYTYFQDGGNEYVEYRIVSKPDWCDVQLSNKFDFETEITVTFEENFIEEARSGEIILEQLLPEEGEKKQIVYTVTQAAAVYEFKFKENDSTEYSTNVEWMEGVGTFTVISLVNNHACDYNYDASSIPSWANVVEESDVYTCTIEMNEDPDNDRTMQIVFTQEHSNRTITFELIQDAMKYIPIDGCEQAPILLFSGGYYRKDDATPTFEPVVRTINRHATDIHMSALSATNCGGNLRFSLDMEYGYTAHVSGGTAQQAYSVVLNDETTWLQYRNLGSHFFSAIPKNNALEIHEIHLGNDDNDSWISDNLNSNLLSTNVLLFGIITKNK